MAKNNNISKSGNQYPPELIDKFLDTQARQIDLQSLSLELQKQSDANNFEFSKKALDAQIEDRKSQRDMSMKMEKNRLYLIGSLGIAMAGVIITALCLGKENVALEIIKAIAYFMAGGASGYGIKKAKDIKAEHQKE